MKHWEQIDNYLVKLERYKKREEWKGYFNSIEGIRNAESETDFEFKTFLIKFHISILEKEEQAYMQLTDKNDTDGYNAVFLLVDVLLNTFIFKNRKKLSKKEEDAIMERLYEVIRYYKKYKRSEYDSW